MQERNAIVLSCDILDGKLVCMFGNGNYESEQMWYSTIDIPANTYIFRYGYKSYLCDLETYNKLEKAQEKATNYNDFCSESYNYLKENCT